ncbi:MAG TPA: hypothetical protein VJ205_03840, partial [Gammaproteobacteria bacterium]|nr:hypothetical protein [Gammaproteobacteria bacterium]
MSQTILSFVTFFIYIATPFYYAHRIVTQSPSRIWIWWVGSLIALLGHGWLLYQVIETPSGQNLSLLNMLSLTTWLMGWGLLSFSIKNALQSLTLILYPVAAISLALMLIFPTQEIIDTSAHLGVLSH